MVNLNHTLAVTTAVKNGADDFTLTYEDSSTAANITEAEATEEKEHQQSMSDECQARYNGVDSGGDPFVSPFGGEGTDKSVVLAKISARKTLYDTGVTEINTAISS